MHSPRRILVMCTLLLTGAILADLPTSARAATYDFEWWSGAPEPWVYEAAPKLLVDVYEDPATPENDVFFRFRNEINTPLGYMSSIVDLHFDTGTVAPSMFSNVSIAQHGGYVRFVTRSPDAQLTLIELSGSRIAWSGDNVAGRVSYSEPKTDGVNPSEFIVLRAILADGFTFADVINAIDVGITTRYVEGPYSNWTTTQKQIYRAGATQGLRFALVVHSIVPNTWNPDGHGLFVTNRRVDSATNAAPSIVAVSASPSTISDTETSQLSVAASDPDAGPAVLSYTWTVVSGGGVLNGANSTAPTYIPPNVTGTQAVMLRVDVSDGSAVTSATVTIQVSDAGAPPPNQSPQITAARATPSTILDTQSSQLSVTASDPDGGPAALSYAWTVVSGGGTLAGANSAAPVYVPADVTGAQTVTLRVDVSDGAATTSANVALEVQDASPPPPGPMLLSADFTDGSLAGWSVRDDGTLVTPSRWRILSGELVQLSNIYGGGTTASEVSKPGTYLRFDGGAAWTDYRMRFVMSSEDDDALGVMFRVRDGNNYYRFTWNKELSYRRLEKNVGGLFSVLASDSVPFVQSRDYQVEIVAAGTQIEVWIDGTRIFQVGDAAHDHGSVAFYTWRNNAAYFDNLVVDAVP